MGFGRPVFPGACNHHGLVVAAILELVEELQTTKRSYKRGWLRSIMAVMARRAREKNSLAGESRERNTGEDWMKW